MTLQQSVNTGFRVGAAMLRMGALLGLCLAAGTLSGAGCKAVGPRAKDRGYCDADRLCEEGKICVPLALGGTRGRCVKECTADEACPKGERCTGRYQKIGTVETFCRKATGGPGDSCAAPPDGCQPGLRCFSGVCQKECQRDADCVEATERCLPVVADAVVERDRVEIFAACMPADQTEGKPCKASGPFCGRGLVCHGEVCVRSCLKDPDCPKGRVCDGALYLGPKREERAKTKDSPDVRYCRQGAKRNQPCHHHLDVGCAAGLSCVGFRCRKVRHVGANRSCDLEKGFFCNEGLLCHAGACRRPCLTDSDCGADHPGAGAGGGSSSAEEGPPPDATSLRMGRRGRRRAARRGPQPTKDRGHKCREVTLRNLPVRLCM